MKEKILFSILSVLMIFCFTACGGDNSQSSNDSGKTKFSADKSVLAWAEMEAFGNSANVDATGMDKAQQEQLSNAVVKGTTELLTAFPVSEECLDKFAQEYFSKLPAKMNISTKIKKADDEHPVVEVTANVIDVSKVNEVASTSENLAQITLVMEQLHEKGVTDEQIKGDSEFQQELAATFVKYLDEMPMITKTFDVTCKIAQGEDGNLYFVPEDSDALKKFLGGL